MVSRPGDSFRRVDRWRVPEGLNQAAGWAWRFVAVTAAIYVLIWVVGQLQVVVVALFVAVVLASALEPAVSWLQRRRVPRIVATWLLLLALLGVVVGVFSLVVPRFIDELEGMDVRLQEGLGQVKDWLQTGPLELSAAEVEELEEEASERASESLTGLVPDAVAGLSLAAQALAGIFLVIVLTFYFTKDGAAMWTWVLRLVDVQRRHRIDVAGQRAVAAVQGWLRGVAITGAFDAVAIGAALVIVGVPLAYALALLTFLGAFIPIIGAVAAGSVAVLVTLASNGLTDAIIVGLVVLVVQQVEGDVILPMVMSRSVALHPVVVLVALAAGAATAGIVGAIVAVPVAAAAVAMIGALAEEPPAPTSPGDQFDPSGRPIEVGGPNAPNVEPEPE